MALTPRQFDAAETTIESARQSGIAKRIEVEGGEAWACPQLDGIISWGVNASAGTLIANGVRRRPRVT